MTQRQDPSHYSSKREFTTFASTPKLCLQLIMNDNIYDLFIIGGGINGCGIAADAAGRGLSVFLCEQYDLASGTSSKSTKLIHGGLRYLEYREFRLVHEALKEREILLNKAPHLIREMRFVLPHEKHLRPAWLLRLGLFIYDHLAKRKIIKSSHQVNLKTDFYGQALKNNFNTGFVYSDCAVDDARLVIANALAAKELGAVIQTHTQCVAAQRESNRWTITLKTPKNETQTIYAKALINASGPWITQAIEQMIHEPTKTPSVLVKGSHIVVPQLYEGKHAYILQNEDKRIIFVIPYEDNLSLIGTTDEPFSGDLNHIEIQASEIDYLCTIVNHYFKKQTSAEQVIWSYSGVRPLYRNQDNHSKALAAISRDYLLELTDQNHLPLVNIFGGKITTYRELAEHVLQKLIPYFPTMKPLWTANTPLPGGDLTVNIETYLVQCIQQYPWLSEPLLHRYVHHYGSRLHLLLENTHSITDMGILFGKDLYEKEVIYLIQHEWAKTADDILFRRTKLGIGFNKEGIKKLEQYLALNYL
jgi:glycerol-3-phosphate dehydrogenase